MFAQMLRRDTGAQWAKRVARTSWLVGVSVREYRELEDGTSPPDADTYARICELFGWPQSFVDGPSAAASAMASTPTTAPRQSSSRRRRGSKRGAGP